MTDAEIADVLAHEPAGPADKPGAVLSGGGTAQPQTPEEEVEQFVSAARSMGMDEAKAREYATQQLETYRGRGP